MREPLPVLGVDAEEAPRWCLDAAPCNDCPFLIGNGGLCEGCNGDFNERCDQAQCYSYCNNCGGGGRVVMPACCGHSPLRNAWAKEVSEWPVQLEPEEVEVKCSLIPMLYEQFRDLKIPESFPQIDTWAVPVKKALNLDGSFKAPDIKAHLGLPGDRKLILINSADDRYMEMLWRHGDELDFHGHNIDYWTPAFFSIYIGDSKLSHFLNAFRQQLNAKDMNSQIVWFHCAEEFPEELFDPILDAKAVILSAQSVNNNRRRQMLLGAIKSVDELFPEDAKVFLLADGGLKHFRLSRPVYRINSRWLQLAIRGRDLLNKYRPELKREELLVRNLQELLENHKQ